MFSRRSRSQSIREIKCLHNVCLYVCMYVCMYVYLSFIFLSFCLSDFPLFVLLLSLAFSMLALFRLCCLSFLQFVNRTIDNIIKQTCGICPQFMMQRQQRRQNQGNLDLKCSHGMTMFSQLLITTTSKFQVQINVTKGKNWYAVFVL